MKENAKIVIDYINENPGCTAEDIIGLGFRRSTAQDILKRCSDRGIIIRNNEGKPYKYYPTKVEKVKLTHPEKLDEKKSYQTAIVQYIKEHPNCTKKEIMVDLQIHETTTENNLYKLQSEGVIYNTSKKRTKQYVIAEHNEEVETENAKQKDSKNKPLPRDLMLQLKAMGYSGMLKRTVEKVIDFEKLTVEQFKKYQELGYTGKITIKKNFDINLDKLN